MTAAAAGTPDTPIRRLPPITEVSVGSMVLVIVGVIYLSSYLPRRAPLAPAIGLLAGAAVLMLVNAVLLARLRDFPWWRFFQVGRWGLLAYVVIAGMLEYTFVYDRVRGSLLVVMTLMLVVFTVNPPLVLAITVSRFQATQRQAGA